VVEVLEPSTVNIATAFFARKPQAICGLRSDSLARILTLSDARPGSNVLVLETCKGLITGAIAERLGGYGKVVTLQIPNRGGLSAVRLYNFPKAVQQSIVQAPLSIIGEINAGTVPATPESMDQGAEDSEKKALHDLFIEGFDSLVVAVKAVPLPFLKALLPFIKPSSPITLFSPFLQQLVECHTELQKPPAAAINLQLSETWLRLYQVLPSRTRPPMNMNGASGFILTGLKVGLSEEEEDAHSTATSPAKKKLKTEPATTDQHAG